MQAHDPPRVKVPGELVTLVGHFAPGQDYLKLRRTPKYIFLVDMVKVPGELVSLVAHSVAGQES